MLDRGLIGVCLAVALTGCMGRPPDPVPVVQPQDRYMNCTAIYAEVRENNRRVRELGREQGWKVVQNVAAGVGGLFIPILWFGMDWQGTAHKEAAALQARQEYLGALAIKSAADAPPRRRFRNGPYAEAGSGASSRIHPSSFAFALASCLARARKWMSWIGALSSPLTWYRFSPVSALTYLTMQFVPSNSCCAYSFGNDCKGLNDPQTVKMVMQRLAA